MKTRTFLSKIVLLVFVGFGGHSVGQTLWGAGSNPAVGVAAGEFQNDFIQAGTFTAGDNANDWTTLSIFEGSGSVSPGNAYWKRNTIGYSQGAYWFGTTPVSSASQANGVAIFDSDYMDNNGVLGAFGTGTSPSPHKGELISPRIDLTGHTNDLIAIKFYSLYREFVVNELSFSFSTDDGATWGTSTDYRSYIPNMTEGFVTINFPAATLQGVSNLSACRIKFTFNGDYYFALIDDVSIQVQCLADATTDVIVTCGPYTWIDGNEYTASDNTATYHMTNVGGCDSVITLDLTINNPTAGTDVISACNSHTWIDGIGYTASNTTATHTLTNAAGCDSVVTLNLTINSPTTGTDIITTCMNYTWIDGIEYTANNTTATHILTNAAGCDSVVTLNLTVNQTDVSVAVNAETITANAGGASYQWIDCDNGNAPIGGETGQSFTATANGNYAVIVTANSCSDTSACTNIASVGIKSNAGKEIFGRVYPNPSTGMFTLQLTRDAVVTVIDAIGQVVLQKPMKAGQSSIDLKHLASAVYFMKVQSEGKTQVIKLTKQD